MTAAHSPPQLTEGTHHRGSALRASRSALSLAARGWGVTLGMGNTGGVITGRLMPFAHRLSSVVNTNVAVVTSVRALGSRYSGPRFGRVLARLGSALRGNGPLSRNLTSCPRIFSRVCMGVMITKRRSNRFTGVLGELTIVLRGSSHLRGGMGDTVACPAAVISVTLLLTVKLVRFIMPIFTRVFSNFNGPLPGVARTLISFSSFAGG